MRWGCNLSVANLLELGYTYFDKHRKVGECMNILIINGSPKGKRSNTYRLTCAFAEGVRQENPEAEIRETEVVRKEIRPCLGCFACWNKTPGKCCMTDDMSAVLEDMLWADLVVWSFPLYYFSVPGPLKNLMDRQLPLVLPFMAEGTESGGHPSRYDRSKQRHVVISTCGFYTAKGNYDGINAMFDHLCGKGNYTTIYCGQGELFRVKELSQRTDEYLGYVKDAGREFCASGITAQTREKLEELLYPRAVFEAMADASWGVEKSGEPTDDALVFTRQMAALYNPKSYGGKDLVLEMNYTDLGKRYQIILGKEGSRVLTGDFKSPVTVIETPYSIWKAIAAGEITGQDAMMKQLYRVKGDFDLMLHWDRYFGQTEEPREAEAAPTEKPTNMNILLIPWITFWIAGAIDAFYGALISLAVCALVPLVYYRSKKTFYDLLSGVLVTGCALTLLLGIGNRIVVPLSYLCFGAMWAGSCLTSVPLTAHYSQNEYGGNGALSNPLFVKTNRILTLCWGVLYLLTPIWTYFLMGTAVASFVGAINSVLPMLMGLFTAWFQKWYPAKIARGN